MPRLQHDVVATATETKTPITQAYTLNTVLLGRVQVHDVWKYNPVTSRLRAEGENPQRMSTCSLQKSKINNLASDHSYAPGITSTYCREICEFHSTSVWEIMQVLYNISSYQDKYLIRSQVKDLLQHEANTRRQLCLIL